MAKELEWYDYEDIRDSVNKLNNDFRDFHGFVRGKIDEMEKNNMNLDASTMNSKKELSQLKQDSRAELTRFKKEIIDTNKRMLEDFSRKGEDILRKSLEKNERLLEREISRQIRDQVRSKKYDNINGIVNKNPKLSMLERKMKEVDSYVKRNTVSPEVMQKVLRAERMEIAEKVEEILTDHFEKTKVQRPEPQRIEKPRIERVHVPVPADNQDFKEDIEMIRKEMHHKLREIDKRLTDNYDTDIAGLVGQIQELRDMVFMLRKNMNKGE